MPARARTRTEADLLLAERYKGELLKVCRDAFVALTSAEASKNFLIMRHGRRQYGYTPQEAVAHYMVEFLGDDE